MKRFGNQLELLRHVQGPPRRGPSSFRHRVWDPVLIRGAELNKVGRTSANDFLAARPTSLGVSRTVPSSCVMRRSLLFWNGETRKWQRHEDPLTLTEPEAKSVARVLMSPSSQEVSKDCRRVAL